MVEYRSELINIDVSRNPDWEALTRARECDTIDCRFVGHEKITLSALRHNRTSGSGCVEIGRALPSLTRGSLIETLLLSLWLYIFVQCLALILSPTT